jgi:hypothetical protein
MLCLLLATYAVAVFGYITMNRDAETPDGAIAGERAIEELRSEIRALREALLADARRSGRHAAMP